MGSKGKGRRPRKDRQGRSSRSGGPEQPPLPPVRTPIPIPGSQPPEIIAAEPPAPNLVSIEGGKKKTPKLREHDKVLTTSKGALPPAGAPLPPVIAAPPGEPLLGMWSDEPSILFPFRRRLDVPAFESPDEREIRDQQERFLHGIFQYGNKSRASTALGVDTRRHNKWCDEYPAYAKAAQEAEDEHTELLEAEADRRGLQGYLEPVLYQGRLVMGPDGKYLMKRVVSDILLMFRLNGLKPERYRGHRVPMSAGQLSKTPSAAEEEMGLEAGADYDLTKLSQEELSTLRGSLLKMKAPGQTA